MFLFLLLIFNNAFCSEVFTGSYFGKPYEFVLTSGRVEGYQGDSPLRYYFSPQGIFGRDVSGVDIDLLFKKNNIWGKALCGDIDLYQDSKSFIMTGFFCGKRIKAKLKKSLLESYWLEEGFFKNLNLELKNVLKRKIKEILSLK